MLRRRVRRGGVLRPRNVAVTDKREPMLRLLEDGDSNGSIYVCYAEQWRTLFKAIRLGFVTDDVDQKITEKGIAYRAAKRAEYDAREKV